MVDNQLGIGNYELRIGGWLIIRVIKKIMVQTKSCYKHGSQTSSLQTRMRGMVDNQLGIGNYELVVG